MALRLAPDTLDKLDRIMAHLKVEPESEVGRPQAIRFAIRRCVELIEQGELGG